MKRAKLRAIDQGTRYDITGNLRRLAREIEAGKHGDVRDVVLAVRIKKLGGGEASNLYHFGNGSIPDCLYMWEKAKREMV